MDHLHRFAWSCTYFVCLPAALITWLEIPGINDWMRTHFLYASTRFPPQPHHFLCCCPPTLKCTCGHSTSRSWRLPVSLWKLASYHLYWWNWHTGNSCQCSDSLRLVIWVTGTRWVDLLCMDNTNHCYNFSYFVLFTYVFSLFLEVSHGAAALTHFSLTHIAATLLTHCTAVVLTHSIAILIVLPHWCSIYIVDSLVDYSLASL